MRGRSTVLRRSGRRARPTCPLHAEVLEGRQLLAVFTVTNAADSGLGSLRQAILDANSTNFPGLDGITFSIAPGGPQTIDLLSPLPTITDALIIDGTFQPGFDPANPAPLIELNGAGAGQLADGLVVAADNSAVRGLAINRFVGAGIRVQADATTIAGNYIGTDGTGTLRRANEQGGIVIENGSFNSIGGTTPAQRNVISGNNSHGISIVGSPAASAQANLILGNFIGTDASGASALGNQESGVDVAGGIGNTIGGTAVGAGNLIAGNSGNGIRIAGEAALNTVVQANRIGTDVTGGLPLGNVLAGVDDQSGVGTLIGGQGSSGANIIAANGGGGVRLSGTATAAVVQGNFIGTNDFGATLGNVGFGVRVASDNNTIGGPAGGGNVIAFTVPDPFGFGPGVAVANGRFGNAILSNSISSNAGLGIDLGDDDQVQLNDEDDGDTGANNGQNFPVIVQAGTAAGSTQVVGSFNSTPNATFTLQFFANAATDPTVFGEGETLIGSTSVTTDAGGDATFRVTFPVDTSNRFITATATNAAGETSEFSRAATAAVVPTTDLTVTKQAVPTPAMVNENLIYTVTVSNVGAVDATNVVLTDVLPITAPLVSVLVDGSAPAPGTFIQNGNALTFNFGTILTGSTPRTVTITVRPTAFGTITNQASATNDLIDATPADNTATLDTQVGAPQGTAIVRFLSAAFNALEQDGTAVITVIRSTDAGTTTVNFTTGDGSAAAGADYGPTTGTLTFDPGELVKTFAIPIADDFAIEPDETVLLGLFSPNPGSVLTSPGGAVLTIQDNDPTPEGGGSFRFGSPVYVVDENANIFQRIVVERVGGQQGDVAVDFSTADLTARAGVDYIPARSQSGAEVFDFVTVAFADGDDSPKFLFIQVLNDNADLGNKTVNLILSNPRRVRFEVDPTGMTPTRIVSIPNDEPGLPVPTLAGPAQAVLTIVDVLPPPLFPQTVMFNAAAYAVDERDGTATITVTRNGADGQVRVNFTTSDGTASAGVDYRATSGILTFNPGQTLRTFTIPIIDDAVQAGNRTVNVTLSNPSTNASIAIPSTVVLTIVDNETPQTFTPAVMFSAATYAVDETAGTATLIVTRPDFTDTVRVDFATVGGTADAGIKYVPVAGTLVFNPNETAKVLTIPIINTNQFEGPQTVRVALRNPSPNTSLGTPSMAVLSILDDEPPPTPTPRPGAIAFGVAAFSAAEDGGTATITLVRTGGSDGSVAVTLATSGGTATPGVRYTPVTTSVVFAAGQTTATVAIPLINNTTNDGDQTVGLVLSSPSGGATLGAQATATLTIVEDERDVTGPSVRDVRLLGDARTITGVVLRFDEQLDAARATNPANFSFIALGRDGLLGTRDDRPVGVQSVTYDPLTGNLTLIPAQPLRANRFTRLVVNGAAPSGLTDSRSNLLDGDGDGAAGGNYAITFARAAQLRYNDRNRDAVTLRLARGGLLDLVRAADGEGQSLRLLNTVPGRSVLSGNVRRRRGGDGRTSLPTIVGLDSSVRSRLRTPPFFIGEIVAAGVDALLAEGAPPVGRRSPRTP